MTLRLLILAGGIGLWLLIFLALQRDSRIRIDRMKAVARSRTKQGEFQMDPREQGTQSTGRDRQVGDRPTGSQGNVRQPVGDKEYTDIEKRFTTEPLIGDNLQMFKSVTFAAKDLATKVIENIPNNRERALALTHLEEFSIWCEKALIHGVNV